MNIIPKFLQTRCRVCKREKTRAKEEQVAKAATCGGGVECPFQPQISEAIQYAYRVQLVSLDLSSEEVLEGSVIKVSWQTANCKSASISNYGLVPPSGTIDLPITRRMRKIEISLVDRFDQVFRHARRIKVRRKPALKIIESREKVLRGERVLLRFEATNAKRVLLTHENGRVEDLQRWEFFESEALSQNTTFSLSAIGKYGGEATQQVSVRVFDPPFIHYFRTHCEETVDSLPIQFAFDYGNESQVKILRDSLLIADVSNKKEYTYFADNKTGDVVRPKFELVVTGHTGTQTTIELANPVSIFPQPIITHISCLPDNTILYPEEVRVTAHARFCETVLISEGNRSTMGAPNTPITLNPSINTQYELIPIGKQDFRGAAQQVSVEVLHPVEIEIAADRRITLPNVPVNISWRSRHHSQLVLEPGRIDVTNTNERQIRLAEKTVVKVWGINKRDRKSAELFIDVLPYPRLDAKVFGRLPKVDIRIPKLQKTVLDLPRTSPANNLSRLSVPVLSLNAVSLPHLSHRLLALFQTISPRTQFNLARSMRDRLFTSLKAMTRKN